MPGAQASSIKERAVSSMKERAVLRCWSGRTGWPTSPISRSPKRPP